VGSILRRLGERLHVAILGMDDGIFCLFAAFERAAWRSGLVTHTRMGVIGSCFDMI
jgi:hypothetical protein